MHISKLAIALTLLPMFCQAEGLSPTEREELLKKIEVIEKQSESYVNQKYRTAMKAYTEAMTSENSALELYLKCEEMINFEQKQKKNSDFRDWKKKNDEKFSETAYRRALQLQLQWLSLSLKATSENVDRDKLSLEVATYVDKMLEQAEVLAPYQSILNQGVTSTVFAQAYNIGGIEIKKWPLSPGQISAVYEEIILPPLRRADRIEALKAAWQKRMVQEGELVDKWSSQKASGGLNTHSPAYDKFVTETLPNLRWNAEMDLFKAGDERGSADRMLKHIDTNMSHKSATQWLEQLGKLVNAAPSSVPKSPSKTTPPAE